MKTKLRLSLLAVLLAFSTNAFSQDTNFYIYLCFGQSNMESGGKMDEMDQTVDKRFQVLADFDSTNRGWKKSGCRIFKLPNPNDTLRPSDFVMRFIDR